MNDLQGLGTLQPIGKRRLADTGGDWAMKARTTAEHQVAEILREKIIVGVLARGQKLKQAEIAKMLGVSITPVREALRLLEAQGYVSVSAHRGAVVAPFQIEGAEELYRLRQLLETRLTVEAASRMTPNDLYVLKAINHDLLMAARTGDRAACQEKNFRFHFRFYELAAQPQTLDFVRILWAKYPLDMLSQMPGRQPRVFDEHVALLAALEQGDVEGAAKAMEAHIGSGWAEFQATYGLAAERAGRGS
jgi:DNA-binding GntR family transcriptional regulator